MPYRKELGKVRGDNGKTYIPVSKQNNNTTIIEWIESEEPPTDTIINSYIPIPVYDYENGTLSWSYQTTEPNENISPMRIKGDPLQVLHYNDISSIQNQDKKGNYLYIIEDSYEFSTYVYIEADDLFINISKVSKDIIELEIDIGNQKEIYEIYGFKK